MKKELLKEGVGEEEGKIVDEGNEEESSDVNEIPSFH